MEKALGETHFTRSLRFSFYCAYRECMNIDRVLMGPWLRAHTLIIQLCRVFRVITCRFNHTNSDHSKTLEIGIMPSQTKPLPYLIKPFHDGRSINVTFHVPFSFTAITTRNHFILAVPLPNSVQSPTIQPSFL